MSDQLPPDPARPVPQPDPSSTAYTQPGYGSSPYSPTPSSPTPTLSIISLVLGILGVAAGFVGFGLLFSIGAVVLGHLGQRREPSAKGFWITGLITGYIGIAINLLVLIFLIVALFALSSNVPMYDFR
ncbi:MAG: hypothetical protein JWM51_2250 [Microbacteriaceae bacterium]|nr:hypothetical protein [Microbacteriaceae bacterium]